jgi:hypothetical protein
LRPATWQFRCCRPADKHPKTVARARKVKRVHWRSSSQGWRARATQARRKSHPGPSPSANSYAAAAESAAAAVMRLISAHTRVLGKAHVHLWDPCPDTVVGSHAVADADPAVGPLPARAQSFSARPTSGHVGTRHQRKAAIDKEMAAAPNALSAPRDALARSVSKVPCRFPIGGVTCGESRLASPHFVWANSRRVTPRNSVRATLNRQTGLRRGQLRRSGFAASVKPPQGEPSPVNPAAAGLMQD